MVYDVTVPGESEFVQYVETRDFTEDAAPDAAPEGLAFVSAEESPTDSPPQASAAICFAQR
jgi:hypothetical protein